VFFVKQVYKKAIENLLPTPAKSHYTFNLRDFSRVVQGCLLLKKDSLADKRTMIRLFVHEVYRVFYDRLVDDQDRAWLFTLISNIVKQHFKENFETVFEHLKDGNKLVRKNKKHPRLPHSVNYSLEYYVIITTILYILSYVIDVCDEYEGTSDPVKPKMIRFFMFFPSAL